MPVKAWWKNLTERERTTISISSIMLVILAWYFLLWAPFSTHVALLKDTVTAQRSLLNWMQDAVVQLQQLRQKKMAVEVSDETSLLSHIDQSLKQNSLQKSVTQIEQNAQQVHVKFLEVSADQLVSWLRRLSEEYAIKPVQLTMQATHISGIVRAEITLQ